MCCCTLAHLQGERTSPYPNHTGLATRVPRRVPTEATREKSTPPSLSPDLWWQHTGLAMETSARAGIQLPKQASSLDLQLTPGRWERKVPPACIA